MRAKLFPVTIILLVCLAMFAALFLALNQETLSASDKLGKDVFRLTYQFLLLVVLGGAISIVYKEYSSERDQARADREKLRAEAASLKETWRDLSAKLIEIYNDAKRIRRLLRARALRKGIGRQEGNDEITLIVDEYDKLMQELNDVQLSFETQKRLATADSCVVKAAPDIVDHLKSIERYLNNIIQEYETNLPTFDHEEAPLESLDFLQEYIGHAKRSVEFKSSFKEPFLDMLTSLRKAQQMSDAQVHKLTADEVVKE